MANITCWVYIVLNLNIRVYETETTLSLSHRLEASGIKRVLQVNAKSLIQLQIHQENISDSKSFVRTLNTIILARLGTEPLRQKRAASSEQESGGKLLSGTRNGFFPGPLPNCFTSYVKLILCLFSEAVGIAVGLRCISWLPCSIQSSVTWV